MCDQDQYFGSVFAQKGLEFNKIHCVCSALCRIWTRQFIGYIYIYSDGEFVDSVVGEKRDAGGSL